MVSWGAILPRSGVRSWKTPASTVSMVTVAIGVRTERCAPPMTATARVTIAPSARVEPTPIMIRLFRRAERGTLRSMSTLMRVLQPKQYEAIEALGETT